jgi:hypothetical protein
VASGKRLNVWTSDNICLSSDRWHQGPYHELLDEFSLVRGGTITPIRARAASSSGIEAGVADRRLGHGGDVTGCVVLL